MVDYELRSIALIGHGLASMSVGFILMIFYATTNTIFEYMSAPLMMGGAILFAIGISTEPPKLKLQTTMEDFL